METIEVNNDGALISDNNLKVYPSGPTIGEIHEDRLLMENFYNYVGQELSKKDSDLQDFLNQKVPG